MGVTAASTAPATSEEVRTLRDRYVTHGISAASTVVASASGAVLHDVDGNRYVDFIGGIGSQNVGHAHPAVMAAIRAQLDAFQHTCFITALYEPYVAMARRLAELSPCGGEQKSLLMNSGSEAMENAVKAARAATGRGGVLVFDRAFHGRTLLTLTMSGRVSPYKKGFGPLATEVYRAAAPYPFRGITVEDALADLERVLLTTVSPDDLACMVIEPVQGEGGFIPMPAEFLRRLREICTEHGIVLVVDEVQCGVGRTGTVWAIEQSGVQPDLLVSGKSLGGGLPLAAVTGDGAILDAVPTRGYGGTFGGNPVACAAGLAVLDVVSSPRFLARAREIADRLRARLDPLVGSQHGVGEVRGLGPMIGVELVARDGDLAAAADRAASVVDRCRERGLMILRCGSHDNVLRILVPLSVTDDELDEGTDILAGVLAEGARS